jgi:hypothetical protein
MIVGLLRLRQQRCRGRVAALQKVTRAAFFLFPTALFFFQREEKKRRKKRVVAYFFVKSLYAKRFVENYIMYLHLFFLFVRA